VSAKPDPEIDAALRSVSESPLDDGRKRVFTDLLLERGDPRGEFMLLQFVIGAKQASGAVRQRALELWQRHKKEWTKDVAGVLTDIELENGFPAAGTVGPTTTPEKILGSAMFVTLKKLRAKADGAPLLIAAAADPRLTGLEALELDDPETFRAVATQGVAGRLRHLRLRLNFGMPQAALLLAAPAYSQVRSLAFQPVYRTPPRRRGVVQRIRDVLTGSTEEGSLARVLLELDKHPTLEALDLPGGIGDLELFAQVAEVWPKVEFRRISAAGTFELEREEGGSLLVLQNFDSDALLRLRPMVPRDVKRARLMRRKRYDEDTDALIKAWAPIAITSW
jgi:hypothetical protein